VGRCGVGDDGVPAPAVREGRAEALADLLLGGDVDLVGPGAHPAGGQRCAGRIVLGHVTTPDRDVGAGLGERERHPEADPAVAPGDEGDAAGQVEGHVGHQPVPWLRPRATTAARRCSTAAGSKPRSTHARLAAASTSSPRAVQLLGGRVRGGQQGADGGAVVAVDRAGELLRARQQLRVRQDLADEPGAQGVLPTEEVARQAHLPGDTGADGRGQQHGRAPAGHHAHQGMRVGEGRARRRSAGRSAGPARARR